MTVTVSLLRADGQERVVEFPRGLQVPSASPRHLPAKAVAGLCQGRVPGGAGTMLVNTVPFGVSGGREVKEHCSKVSLSPLAGSGPSPLSPPVLECLFLDLEKEGFGPDVTPRGSTRLFEGSQQVFTRLPAVLKLV